MKRNMITEDRLRAIWAEAIGKAPQEPVYRDSLRTVRCLSEENPFVSPEKVMSDVFIEIDETNDGEPWGILSWHNYNRAKSVCDEVSRRIADLLGIA